MEALQQHIPDHLLRSVGIDLPLREWEALQGLRIANPRLYRERLREIVQDADPRYSIALHDSTCPACGSRIQAGSWISRSPDGWVHYYPVCPSPNPHTATLSGPSDTRGGISDDV